MIDCVLLSSHHATQNEPTMKGPSRSRSRFWSLKGRQKGKHPPPPPPSRKRQDSLSLVTPLKGINPHLEFLDDVAMGKIKNEHGAPLQLYDMSPHKAAMTPDQKRLDTFCISVAVALFSDHTQAGRVRRELLLHFARIVFGQASVKECASVDDVLRPEIQKQLVVRESAASHPAVQQWIYRQHLKDPTLHKAAEDWFMAYPEYMRTQALLFLRDHKKSSKGRIKCKFTFALLVADLYKCKVCFYHTVHPLNQLAKVEQTQWYFSKTTLDDQDDTILEDDGNWYTGTEYDMQHATPVIMYHANRSFDLLLTEERAKHIAPAPDKEDTVTPSQEDRDDGDGGVFMRRKGEDAIYVLRKYTVSKSEARDGTLVEDPQNHALGDLVATAPNSSVFVFRFEADQRPDPDAVYQIYSNHRVTRSRLLFIPEDTQLFVFLIKQSMVVAYTGRKTDSVDVPPHFKLRADTDGVLVVTAASEAEARAAILENTDLKFETKKKKAKDKAKDKGKMK